MAEKKKKLLPEATTPLVFLTAETYGKFVEVMSLIDATFDPRIFKVKQKAGGKDVTIPALEEFIQKTGESAVGCPLGTLARDAENSTESVTKYIITPGYVHGGGSSELLEKDSISPAIGDKLYLEINFTADSNNGVILGSGTMNSASIKQGSSVPADDTLTIDTLTGKHYRILGEWIDDGNSNPQWIHDGCGSYTFEFCRTFSGSRVSQSNEIY